MDCDRVFYFLTRGPFPSGAPEDPDVEEHLRECLSCWRLAEALRPAEQLLQEGISPAESHDLPGYWGDTTPPGVMVSRLADRTANAVVAPATRRSAKPLPTRSPVVRTAGRKDIPSLAGIMLLVAVAVLIAWWLMQQP